uniref:Uncharacterized protein n=1 Tax=Amphimedon queenslandica TaxID=400682 RepID=A0A1X7V5C5_AMPQE
MPDEQKIHHHKADEQNIHHHKADEQQIHHHNADELKIMHQKADEQRKLPAFEDIIEILAALNRNCPFRIRFWEDDRENIALPEGNTEEKETEESTEIQDKEPDKVSFEATSVRRQNFGRTTHLETLTVDDCPDLRDNALYLTSSTSAGKSNGVSKSEVTD